MCIGKCLLAVILATRCSIVLAATQSTQAQGNTNDAPSLGEAYPQAPNGDFVSLDNLGQVHAGMSKEQVHSLLGDPHFSERLSGLDQWNYLFNTHGDNGEKYMACQYRVRYDMSNGGHRANSVEWNTSDCQAQAGRNMEAIGGALKTFSLWSEVPFAFAKSGPDDILPGGLEDLSEMVEALGASKVATIQVTGYADRVGNREDNRLLSQRRADTVREFLVRRGIPAKGLSVYGAGEAEPVERCGDVLSTDELMKCLQPNRRVEVLIKGLE